MKPRVADQLKAMGCEASVETFRATLVEAKAELFPTLSVDELIYTRDQASDYCNEVKRRLGAAKLTRVFILRGLVGIRKMKKRPASIQG